MPAPQRGRLIMDVIDRGQGADGTTQKDSNDHCTGTNRLGCQVLLICCCAPQVRADEAKLAQQILAETGVQGGVIVHLGCSFKTSATVC